MSFFKEYIYEIIVIVLFLILFFVYPFFFVEKFGFGPVFVESGLVLCFSFFYGFLTENESLKWLLLLLVFVLSAVSMLIFASPVYLFVSLLLVLFSLVGVFFGTAIGKNGLI